MKVLLFLFLFIMKIVSFKNYNLHSKRKYYCFDKDFAESISKPLPSSYLKRENSTQLYNEYTHSNSFKYNVSKNIENKEIVLPGFFEIFPMLDWKWPVWTMKNGKRIQCKTDDDCKFPQSCCHHPIIPGDKFCCSGGYKQRVMKHSYIPQEIRIT